MVGSCDRRPRYDIIPQKVTSVAIIGNLSPLSRLHKNYEGLLRACANRRVSYVSKSSKKAVQSLREMSCAKGCPPIGAASYSPECVEGESSEGQLPLYGVLRSSQKPA